VSALDFMAQEWMLISALAVLAVAYFVINSGQGGKSISVHDLSRLVNAGDAVLVDIREASEYKSGHITGAVNLPYGTLSTRLGELDKYKSKTLILVDKLGQHASASGKILQQEGFNVLRLGGGMSEWLHQNLPTVKK
jgi:rhodanese-related sulfurtransferase